MRPSSRVIEIKVEFLSKQPCTCVMLLTFSLPGGGAPRGGAPVLRNRRVPPPQSRRRGQGVITGLAARRPAALLKRGTFNRAAVNQVIYDVLECTRRLRVWALNVDSDIGLY